MEKISKEMILKIKNDSIEKFKLKDKHPSDILINEICNSFLNSSYGKVILEKIKNMSFNEKKVLFSECINEKKVD